jgi:hypothetical protein
MKRILLIVSLFILSGCGETTIIDCKGNDNVAGICMDSTPPVISGVSDRVLVMGEDFDPLQGITAIDDLDGDITDQMMVYQNVNTNQPGTYIVRYEATDSFQNTSEKIAYVRVEYDTVLGLNLISNGSFDQGLIGYYIYEEEGSADADFDIVDNTLVVDVTNYTEGRWYSPRISYGNIPLVEGNMYRVTFTAKSDLSRLINVQVGELLDMDPWFDDFAPNIQKQIELTSEYQTFEFVFTMEKQTNENASILFEFGDIGGNNIDTVIYLDDITFEYIEDYEVTTELQAPGRIEAEDYTTMIGVQTEVTSDVDGNLNVGWIDAGDRLNYDIEVVESGYYFVVLRLASPSDSGELNFLQNNIVQFTMDIPDTGGWQNWSSELSDLIYIDAGIYTFSITTTTGGFNINYLEFEKVN